MELQKETCPVCGQGERNPEQLMCSKCNGHYDDKVAKAQRDGAVVVMNRMEYAYFSGQKTLGRLQQELSESGPRREKALSQAKQRLHKVLLSEGTVTIDKIEWGRRCAKIFQEIVGGEATANRLSDVANFHGNLIQSLKNFLGDIGKKFAVDASDEQEEKQVA